MTVARLIARHLDTVILHLPRERQEDHGVIVSHPLLERELEWTPAGAGRVAEILPGIQVEVDTQHAHGAIRLTLGPEWLWQRSAADIAADLARDLAIEIGEHALYRVDVAADLEISADDQPSRRSRARDGVLEDVRDRAGQLAQRRRWAVEAAAREVDPDPVEIARAIASTLRRDHARGGRTAREVADDLMLDYLEAALALPASYGLPRLFGRPGSPRGMTVAIGTAGSAIQIKIYLKTSRYHLPEIHRYRDRWLAGGWSGLRCPAGHRGELGQHCGRCPPGAAPVGAAEVLRLEAYWPRRYLAEVTLADLAGAPDWICDRGGQGRGPILGSHVPPELREPILASGPSAGRPRQHRSSPVADAQATYWTRRAAAAERRAEEAAGVPSASALLDELRAARRGEEERASRRRRLVAEIAGLELGVRRDLVRLEELGDGSELRRRLLAAARRRGEPEDRVTGAGALVEAARATLEASTQRLEEARERLRIHDLPPADRRVKYTELIARLERERAEAFADGEGAEWEAADGRALAELLRLRGET